MGRLIVVTVPPDARNDCYVVILGDCILPGHVLGKYETAAEADASCLKFADHYNLTPYRLSEPWKPPALTLIQGGLTTDLTKT